jgi:hypothetical protein
MPAESGPRDGETVRTLLARLIAAHEEISRGQAARVDLANLAERALAIDPVAARWSQLASRIQSAHAQVASRPADGGKILEAVIADVASAAGVGLVPRAGLPAHRSALERAWSAGGSK